MELILNPLWRLFQRRVRDQLDLFRQLLILAPGAFPFPVGRTFHARQRVIQKVAARRVEKTRRRGLSTNGILRKTGRGTHDSQSMKDSFQHHAWGGPP